MSKRKNKPLLILVVSLISLLNIVGLINYTPLISWNWWYLFELLLLSLCILYFQFRSVKLGSISISLSLSVYIPIILLYGIGEAMWISCLVTIVHTLANKRPFNKLILNCMQRSFSALATGQVFLRLGGEIGNLIIPGSLLPALLASLTYNIVNMGTVMGISLLMGTISGQAARRFFKSNIHAMSSTLLFAYTGIIYALMIASLEFYGLLLFAVLLLGYSETLQHGAKLNAEQSLRLKAEQELVLDSKTKVYNYRYLRDWLEKNAPLEPMAVLFIDIDDFKFFNDYYGHDQGDQALRNVAAAIATSVRSADRVIRFGGEEFVVLLPGLNGEQALEVANRIQGQLKRIPEASMEHPITVSIGVATYPDDAKDIHELLRFADKAMYQAKVSGKNQSCVFCPESCSQTHSG